METAEIRAAACGNMSRGKRSIEDTLQILYDMNDDYSYTKTNPSVSNYIYIQSYEKQKQN